VTAVDPAMRLVEVTRARLAGEGFDATVVVGEAQALPFADESFGRATAAANGSTSNPPFSWHDRDAVEGVAAGHGARVAAHDGEVAFVGDSPEAHFAAQEQSHPMALAMQALLERPGRIRPSARRRSRSCVGEANLPIRSVSRARIACSGSARPGRRAQPQLRTS
jgi:hypothetical protein